MGLECLYTEENTGYWEDTYEVVEEGYLHCEHCDGRVRDLWAEDRPVN